MKRFKTMALVLGCALLLGGSAFAVSTFSQKGWVKSPNYKRYTVKANPGESFTVFVNSDKPTNVYLNYMTAKNGQYWYNKVRESRGSKRHRIPFTAPSGKPANNMSHWFYSIQIGASGNQPSDAASFTVTVR